MSITTNPAPTIRLTTADHPRAVTTLSAAFHHDPVFEWIYVDADHRRRAVPHLFSVLVEEFGSRGAARATPDVDGAALWLPPGEELLADAGAEATIAEMARRAGPAAGRLLECFEILGEHHPHDAHWYLGFLGVDPALQGLGLGGGLLRSTLDRLDAIGEPAYLEATSAANRRLYARHGFEVVRELPLPEGPSLFAMWRDPRPGAAD